jgi:hypothetical protein
MITFLGANILKRQTAINMSKIQFKYTTPELRIPLCRMQIFYSTFCILPYTLSITIHHVFFFSFPYKITMI